MRNYHLIEAGVGLAIASGFLLAACDEPKTDFGSMPATFLGGNGGTAPQTLFGDTPATFLGKDAGAQPVEDTFIQEMLKTSWELNPFRIGTAYADGNHNCGTCGSPMQSAPKTLGGISSRRPYVAGGYSYPDKTFGYYYAKFFTFIAPEQRWMESYTGNMPATFLGEVKQGVGDIKAGWLGTITGQPGWVGSQFSNVTSDSGWRGPGMGN